MNLLDLTLFINLLPPYPAQAYTQGPTLYKMKKIGGCYRGLFIGGNAIIFSNLPTHNLLFIYHYAKIPLCLKEYIKENTILIKSRDLLKMI
jgi:hypothetical protein